MHAPTSPRWLYAVGVAAVVLGLYLWVFSPIRAQLKGLDQRIQETQRIVSELQSLAATVNQDTETTTTTSLPEGFTLFSHVETAATKGKLKEHIEDIRPSTHDLGGGVREFVVDLRISGIDFADLLAFLQDMEEGQPPVRVRQLTLQPAAKTGLSADISLSVLGR